MYFRSLLYSLPNAPMILNMQLILEILISQNLRLSMLLSGNAHSQAILGSIAHFTLRSIYAISLWNL